MNRIVNQLMLTNQKIKINEAAKNVLQTLFEF